jgi:hypothetical protein
MILFPYAKDIEYMDGELGFVLQFFNRSNTTEISIRMGLDTDLSEVIERLMNTQDEEV